MALINCEECGKQISDKAVSCPKCGFVTQTQKKRSGLSWYIYLIVALLAIYIASQCRETKPVEYAQHEKAYLYDWRPVKTNEFAQLGRIIVANDIKVCGEYQVKYLDDSTYLLGCTPDGYNWQYFYLDTTKEKVYHVDSNTKAKIKSPR